MQGLLEVVIVITIDGHTSPWACGVLCNTVHLALQPNLLLLLLAYAFEQAGAPGRVHDPDPAAGCSL